MRLFNVSTAIRALTILAALGSLPYATIQAKPSKADCKGHANAVKELSAQLGLSPEVGGRVMMNAVEVWTGGQDPATIEQVATRIEQTVEGIKECEANGMGGTVRNAKTMGNKLKSILPWLQAAVDAGPCQDLINEAVRKKDEDLDGAIEDLERSVRECDDAAWVSEARANLIGMYYERNGGGGSDLDRARALTREALETTTLHGEENKKAFRAIMAKSMVEAGLDLMESGDQAAVRKHWEAYSDVFGTTDFGILAEGGQSVDGLWELGDAGYQVTLACLELGDIDCVKERIRASAETYKDDSRQLRSMIERTFEQADAGGGSPDYTVPFDLLTLWQEIDPESFQLGRFIDDKITSRPDDERLALLRSTTRCWIPMHVTQALRDEERPFMAEAEIAAACGGEGGEAQQMILAMRLQAVEDKLDRLAFGGKSTSEVNAVLAEVEAMLPDVPDAEARERFKAKIAAERTKMRRAAADAAKNREERYAGCTDLLATIQWNMARENDYDTEVRDFKASCCTFLRGSTSGWSSHMAAKLSPDQVEKKVTLMRRFCN